MTDEALKPAPRGFPRLAAFLLILVTCVGCDQAAKRVARSELEGREPIELVSGVVRLQYAENTGAFLGLGDGLSPALRFWLLGVGTALILGLTVLWLLRSGARPAVFAACALICAGGVGNLIDRLRAGFVVDFVSLGVGGVRTGIFNVADVAITVGAIYVFVESFRKAPGETRVTPG